MVNECSEKLKDLLYPFLSSEEKKQLDSISKEKRRAEWLGIRALIYEELGYYPGIVYDFNGKPVLQDKMNISVTHSNGLIGLVISEFDTPGADIEIVAERINRIAQKFTFPENFKRMKPNHRNRHLYAIWCGKETLFKIYSKGNLDFKENLFIDTRNLKTEGTMNAQIKTDNFEVDYNLNYHFFEYNNKEFIFTYYFGEGQG